MSQSSDNQALATRSSVDQEFDRELVMQQAFLAALIRTLGASPSDVNDLLQATNLYLVQNRHLYQEGTNFRAWAAQVARYRCMNFFRSKNARSWVDLSEETVEALTDDMISIHDETEEQIHHLKDCMKKLPSEQQKFIQAVYSLGVSIKDYAIQVKMSHEAARKNISRIRAVLKNCVESVK